jgi:hypothetical protein
MISGPMSLSVMNPSSVRSRSARGLGVVLEHVLEVVVLRLRALDLPFQVSRLGLLLLLERALAAFLFSLLALLAGGLAWRRTS